VTARGRALPGGDGAAVRVIGAAFDTTARREGELLVGRVLESMPAAFFSVGHDSRISYVNAEAERLLGEGREGIVGRDLWDVFPAAVGSEFQTNVDEAVATGEPRAFEAFYPAPPYGWYELRVWPTPDGLSVYFLDVTSRHEAQQEADRATARSTLLAEVSAGLTGTLDPEVAVFRLAHLVVPRLADWCLVTLVDDGIGGWHVGWEHRDPAMRQTTEKYSTVRLPVTDDSNFLSEILASDQPLVTRHGATELISRRLPPGEAAELLARLAPESVAVLPLEGRGRLVGLLTVFNGAARGPFSDDDLDTLEDVAGRAGLALDNARLYAQQFQLAEGLQRSLLTAPPETGDVHVVVRYEPAAETAKVGGDWYDSFVQRDGATMLVIGDVIGHDSAAAAAMGQLRGLLRGIAYATGGGPAAVLRGLDDAMQGLQIGTTATAAIVRLQSATDRDGRPVTRLRWSNAGHPPPLVVGADGSVLDLGSPDADLLLGIDPLTARTEHETLLAPGSTLFLYTDGLVERRRQSLDEGLDRLREALVELAGHPLEDLCDAVLRRLLPNRGDDDVALLAVRLQG
jgi:PAS domain S-box-containing protein